MTGEAVWESRGRCSRQGHGLCKGPGARKGPPVLEEEPGAQCEDKGKEDHR